MRLSAWTWTWSQNSMTSCIECINWLVLKSKIKELEAHEKELQAALRHRGTWLLTGEQHMHACHAHAMHPCQAAGWPGVAPACTDVCAADCRNAVPPSSMAVGTSAVVPVSKGAWNCEWSQAAHQAQKYAAHQVQRYAAHQAQQSMRLQGHCSVAAALTRSHCCKHAKAQLLSRLLEFHFETLTW